MAESVVAIPNSHPETNIRTNFCLVRPIIPEWNVLICFKILAEEGYDRINARILTRISLPVAYLQAIDLCSFETVGRFPVLGSHLIFKEFGNTFKGCWKTLCQKLDFHLNTHCSEKSTSENSDCRNLYIQCAES